MGETASVYREDKRCRIVEELVRVIDRQLEMWDQYKHEQKHYLHRSPSGVPEAV